MIRVYNFESAAYRLFCELAQYFLSFIRLKKKTFSMLFQKKNKGFDIEEAHNFKMWMETPYLDTHLKAK